MKIRSNPLRRNNKRLDPLTRRKLGLPSPLVEHTCQDRYRQGSGLILPSAREAFGTRAKVLTEECDSFQRSERGSPPMVAEHFRAHKLVDMQTRMVRYVMKLHRQCVNLPGSSYPTSGKFVHSFNTTYLVKAMKKCPLKKGRFSCRTWTKCVQTRRLTSGGTHSS